MGIYPYTRRRYAPGSGQKKINLAQFLLKIYFWVFGHGGGGYCPSPPPGYAPLVTSMPYLQTMAAPLMNGVHLGAKQTGWE